MEGAFVSCDGPVRRLSLEDAVNYQGPGFVWLHLQGQDEQDLAFIKAQPDIPDVAAGALVATETRPRCDRIEEGAILNLRGPGDCDPADSDRLVSIRLWVTATRIVSLSRRPITALPEVVRKMEAGKIRDSGDLVAAFAWAITTQLDPEVSALGDRLDDVESDLDPHHPVTACAATSPQCARRRSASAASSRRTGTRCATLAGQDFDWLAQDDKLHIIEAADRFARMAEELEAVRERAALLHEQITDLRAEQTDQRALYISVVAFIFLPLTFVTGLLGMNVEGIPYAHTHWAFWGVVTFCALVGISVLLWFKWRQLAAPLTSGLQLDVPIEIVAPALVQVIGREAAAMFLQLPAGRPDRDGGGCACAPAAACGRPCADCRARRRWRHSPRSCGRPGRAG